jgi:CheY-like chemotaxis protein
MRSVEQPCLSDGRLEIRWSETGGPMVKIPDTTGFGSTLVKEVTVGQLRGSLLIEWPPTGMRLVATLPSSIYQHRATISHAAPSEVKTKNSLERGRLLLVEDEILIAMECVQMLSDLGWDIIGPATSIEEARSILINSKMPDIAVLEVNLGGTPVYPLAEQLMEHGIPFIFCTGYEQLEDHKKYAACPIIRKPVDLSFLDQELRRINGLRKVE